MEGSPFEVCCFTGVRQLALGWTILPVVVGSEPAVTMAGISVATIVTGPGGGSLTTISAARRSGRAPTTVLMEFIVMPGEVSDSGLLGDWLGLRGSGHSGRWEQQASHAFRPGAITASHTTQYPRL